MLLCNDFIPVATRVYGREGMDFNTTEVMMFEFGNDPSDAS